MRTSTHFSALSSWVLLIAKAIDSYGCDSRKLFAEVGLDYGKLQDPVARFSYASVERLWHIAAQQTGDSGFGLTVASFWHPTTLHALGYAWLASRSLDHALERAVRYTRVVNTAAQGLLRLEKSPHEYRLVIDTAKVAVDPAVESIDAGMAMLVTMCRASCGRTFHPLRVDMQRTQPTCAQRFSDFFGAPMHYGEDVNALWLDPEVPHEPLATANAELVRVNDRIVTEYLGKLDQSDIGMRVKSKLIERLPSADISEAAIAAALNISLRSLQRKLKEQGTTFSQLLDTTRRELSAHYVRDHQRPLIEIAFLLGFSEPGNFSRAFKRWYGMPPSEYREGRH